MRVSITKGSPNEKLFFINGEDLKESIKAEEVEVGDSFIDSYDVLWFVSDDGLGKCLVSLRPSGYFTVISVENSDDWVNFPISEVTCEFNVNYW